MVEQFSHAGDDDDNDDVDLVKSKRIAIAFKDFIVFFFLRFFEEKKTHGEKSITAMLINLGFRRISFFFFFFFFSFFFFFFFLLLLLTMTKNDIQSDFRFNCKKRGGRAQTFGHE